MMIILALRVLAGWFALGVALGLCWIAACFVARRVADALAGFATVALARRLLAALLLPAVGDEGEQGEVFAGPSLALPRRHGQRTMLSRDVAVRGASSAAGVLRQA
jgi:hypothetical protein